MPIDDRTTNLSYQLPNAANQLVEDVARLRAALQAIDADVFARYTKLEVDQLITDLIGGAPGALNTLNELAAALGDDSNFAATVTNLLALKADVSDVYSKAESDALYVQAPITTANIANDAVTAAKIAANAVTADSIATNAVTTAKIANDAVTAVKIAANAVTTESIAANAVTTAKIAAGAVVTADLADNALSATTAGLGKMADGFFTATTEGRAKFANGFLPPEKLSQPLTLETAKSATGDAVEFTNIPSWVRRITVMLANVSTNNSSTQIIIQLGTSGGFETTFYKGYVTDNTLSAAFNSAYIIAPSPDATRPHYGVAFICLFGSNTWVETGQIANDFNRIYSSAGSKTLSGTLDRIRIATTGGFQFDLGSVNIMYEG